MQHINADKSYISYSTLPTQVKHVCKKIPVYSRSEVLMKAIQQPYH